MGTDYECPEDFDPLANLEALLRSQSDLLDNFDDLLSSTPTTTEEKVLFFDSFEDLLRRQAILVSNFEDMLKDVWYDMSADRQLTFLCSFQDLVNREMTQIAVFHDKINQSWEDIPPANQTRLLASFEDLIRRQADLEASYEDLYKMTYGGLTITKWADKFEAFKGDEVTYHYSVKSWYNKTVENVTVEDSNLGAIAGDVTLHPYESKKFAKTVKISGSTCNTAIVSWTDPSGTQKTDESTRVCVQVIIKSYNINTLKVGNQTSAAVGGDPPEATNIIDIKKTQTSPRVAGTMLTNMENINIGDQHASGYSTGRSKNQIKIQTEQR